MKNNEMKCYYNYNYYLFCRRIERNERKLILISIDYNPLSRVQLSIILLQWQHMICSKLDEWMSETYIHTNDPLSEANVKNKFRDI